MLYNQIATNDPILRQNSVQALLRSLLDPSGNMILDETMIDPYGLAISEMLRSVSDRQGMGGRDSGRAFQANTRDTSNRDPLGSRPTTAVLDPTFNAPLRGGTITPLPGFSAPIFTPNMPAVNMPVRQPYDPAFLMFGRGDSSARSNLIDQLYGGRFPRQF